MSADGKPACCRTRILTDSARKRKRKEVEKCIHENKENGWTFYFKTR
jgi:hypothetical protein